MNGKFKPDPSKLYRAFYKEMENGVERTRFVVGYVTIYDDGSAHVRPVNGEPEVFIRLFEKLVEFVPSDKEKAEMGGTV